MSMQWIRQDARRTLGVGVAVSLALIVLIVAGGANLTRFVTPTAKANPLDYIWRLTEPTTFTRLAVWSSYLAHQLVSWGSIWYAKHQSLQYTRALHPINLFALAANGAFVLWHWLQTQWTYDALAQDVSILTSQGSVILMLVLILSMETPRRGLLFGRVLPFHKRFIHFLRQYHGYIFSWAIVYTFWYHPMVPTVGHLVGFFYMFMLLIQSSLFFTTLHVNRLWTFALEFLVLPHGVLVALQQGNHMWPMFLLGFLAIFFITQMYGLPLSTRTRWLLFVLFVVVNIAIYGFYYGTWASAPRDLLAIPLIDYLSIALIYAIFMLAFGAAQLVRRWALRAASA